MTYIVWLIQRDKIVIIQELMKMKEDIVLKTFAHRKS